MRTAPPNFEEALDIAARPPFRIRREDGLVLISYQERMRDSEARVIWNRTARELRGIVYEEATGRVVSRPFHRFFNLGDPRSGVNPEHPLKPGDLIAPKQDGRLLQAFFVGRKLHLATRGSLKTDAIAPLLRRSWTPEHERLAERASAALGPVTLLFEVVDPEAPVLERPEKAETVFLALRHISTGGYHLPGASEILDELLRETRVPAVRWQPANGETVGALHDSVKNLEGREGYVLWLAEGEFLKLKTSWALGVAQDERRLWSELPQAFVKAFVEGSLDDFVAGLSAYPQAQAKVQVAERLLHEGLEAAVAEGEKYRGIPRKEAYMALSAHFGKKPLSWVWLQVGLAVAQGRDVEDAIRQVLLQARTEEMARGLGLQEV